MRKKTKVSYEEDIVDEEVDNKKPNQTFQQVHKND